jgi:hypothetical protein
MLDACPFATMLAPGHIPHDSVVRKPRCDELWNAAVSTVSQYATMTLAERLDDRAAVMNWIIAIAWSTGGRRDDA